MADLNSVLFVLVVLFGVFVQAAAGFGGPLISMPIGILLVGVGLAKPVITVAALLVGITVVISEYRHINLKELLKMTAVMLIGVVFGLWVFGTLQLTFLLILYAAVIILIGVRRLFFPGKLRVPRFVQESALVGAGIMQGLFVSGGSFLAVYAVDRIPEKKEFRATVNAVWAVLNLFLVGTYFFGGAMTREVLIYSAITAVPCLAVTLFAGWVAKKLSQNLFLKVVYIILIVSGVVLLISNL